MFYSSCGLVAAHRQQVVRRPAALFRALGGALTEFLHLLAPRYTLTRAGIGRGANPGWGFGELYMSLLLFGVVSIVLWFFLVLYEHSGVEPTCGVLSLTVNQAPRAGSSVQDKSFDIFV